MPGRVRKAAAFRGLSSLDDQSARAIADHLLDVVVTWKDAFVSHVILDRVAFGSKNRW